MTHIAPVLFVLLTSSLLRRTAAEASVLCSWTKVLPNDEVHYSFLRQSSPSVRLYHSAWSAAERALLRCAWSDDAAVIQNYLSLCRERTHEFSNHPDGDLDVESMLEAEELCVSVASPGERTGKRQVRSVGGRTAAENQKGQAERSEVRKQRVKRGFIVPGTLWCGSGNKAPSYADLGVFADTDSCCREHDQCKHTILSFHSGFGIFNSNIFTMSHCDCDNKFHRCLMEANDSISDVVGYTFFNLLKMHCFQFSHRLQCTERNWFGMCKETKMALYAEVHPPTLFESPNPTEVSYIMNTTMLPTELLGGSKSDSITAAASIVPTPSTSSASTSITPVTNVTSSITPVTNVTSSITPVTNVTSSITPVTNVTSSITPVTNVTSSITPVTNVTASITPVTNVTASASERPAGPAPERRDELENNLPAKKQPLSELDVTDNRLSCAVYKDLDECRDKILPQQKKYGLHNPEARTLYHCNCTSRLFQTLAKRRQLTEVQTLLLGRVSRSCFLPQDCTAGDICTAVLVRAQLRQPDRSGRTDVEEQRHLQAVALQVRRPNVRRAKRKDRAVRLHKLCLRTVRSRLSRNKTRTRGPDAHRELV